jgi:E3 SUMO-protein ligase PIAS1
MTVVSLKTVITGFGEETVVNLSKGGRKSELQERIIGALNVLHSGGKVEKWQKARAVILQARSGAE